MNLRALMLATVAAVSISTPAMAQVVSEVEGKLIELNRQSRGVSQNLKVFGTRIFSNLPTAP